MLWNIRKSDKTHCIICPNWDENEKSNLMKNRRKVRANCTGFVKASSEQNLQNIRIELQQDRR